MTTAQRAISVLNTYRLVMPVASFNTLCRIICREAHRGDPDAERYIWLLNWVPPQSAN